MDMAQRNVLIPARTSLAHFQLDGHSHFYAGAVAKAFISYVTVLSYTIRRQLSVIRSGCPGRTTRRSMPLRPTPKNPTLRTG